MSESSIARSPPRGNYTIGLNSTEPTSSIFSTSPSQLPRPPRSQDRPDTSPVRSASPPLPPLPSSHDSNLFGNSSNTNHGPWSSRGIVRSEPQPNLAYARRPSTEASRGSSAAWSQATPARSTTHPVAGAREQKDGTHTPTAFRGYSFDDKTPRASSTSTSAASVDPHIPSAATTSKPLHLPPVLLPRSSYTGFNDHPEESIHATHPSSLSAAFEPLKRRAGGGASSNSSDSNYSLDNESEESEPWSGVDIPDDVNAPKSPLLAQTLAEAAAATRQPFASAAPFASFGGEQAMDTEDDIAEGTRESRSRTSSAQSRPTRSRTSSQRLSIASEKGLQVAWWKAEEPEEVVAGTQQEALSPAMEEDSTAQVEFQSIVSSASPEIVSPSQVGLAVEWDESTGSRPSTPLRSTYQPRRPSTSTPEPFEFPDGIRAASPYTMADAAQHSNDTPRESAHHLTPAVPRNISRTSSRASSRSNVDDSGRDSPAYMSSHSHPDTMSNSINDLPPRTISPAQPSPVTLKNDTTPLPSLPPFEDAPISRPPAVPPQSPARKNRKDLPLAPKKSRHRASTIGKAKPVETEADPMPAREEVSPLPQSASAELSPEGRPESILATPLSASDFATAYGDRDFDGPPSATRETFAEDGPSPPNSSHIRTPATLEFVSPVSSFPDSPLVDSLSSPIPASASRRSNSLTRSPSFTQMAQLSAQLSDSIGEVANGPPRDQDLPPFLDSNATTRRPSRINGVNAPEEEPEPTPDRSSLAMSDDVYHDAPMARMSSGEAAAAIANSSRSSTPASQVGTATGSYGRTDAKARAAAFVADLKKAKAAAALASQEPTPQTSPSVASFASPVISVPEPVSPRSDPPNSTKVEASSTPPSEPGSAVPRSSARSTSPFVPAAQEQLSSPPLPQPPRPITSSPSLSSTLNSPPIPALPPPPPLRHQTSDLRRTPISPPTTLHRGEGHRVELHRRRPLPPCLQVASEIKSARTGGERARIYTSKINALRREQSGLNAWVLTVREGTGGVGRIGSVPSSPTKTRRSRDQDASTATFAYRGDGYRAKEISSGGSFSRDQVPSVPYPGVLSPSSASTTTLSSISSTSRNIPSSKATPPLSAINPKSSFFSGLSRKGSKRTGGGIGPNSSSIPPPIIPPTGIRAGISSPLSAPVTAPTSSLGRSSLSGPRMPNSRASIDITPTSTSPSSSPLLPPIAPSRASFSYGSSTGSPVPGSSTSFSGSPSTSAAALERLGDILPMADKNALSHALLKANGDEVLAISVYLSDEAMRRGT